MESKDKELIVKKDNFFSKVFSFFRNIFYKENASENVIADEKVENNYNLIKEKQANFSEKLKSPDQRFIDIQHSLEKNGINENNLKKLVSGLSIEEKEKLKELYVNQNERLLSEIEGYKRKIMAIKSEF